MRFFTRLALAAMILCGLSLDAHAARVYLPFRCSDSDGIPLSGCRAYTFEAGTTTIYQTFSDSALSSGNGDYVTADSSGLFPDTYAANTQCLKVKFTESDGTTVVATMDNYCPTLSTAEITTSLLTGTAAAESVGTSGNALCKTNAACIWSALVTFNSDIEVNSTSAAATAAPEITLSRDSTSPAADDKIGKLTYQGKSDATTDRDYAFTQGGITDPSDGAEYGSFEIGAILNGTGTTIAQIGAFDSSDTSLQGVNVASGNFFKAGFYAPGTPLAVLEYQATSGTSDNGCTSGSDATRQLNTEVFDPYSLVSISSNQFTLQPGTYLIHWSAPAVRVNSHQSLLYDITGTAEVKRGSTEESDCCTDSESEGLHVATHSIGWARVTIASANTYEIRHRCETTNATDGFGAAASFGTEVFTQVTIYAGWWVLFLVIPAPMNRRRKSA